MLGMQIRFTISSFQSDVTSEALDMYGLHRRAYTGWWVVLRTRNSIGPAGGLLVDLLKISTVTGEIDDKFTINVACCVSKGTSQLRRIYCSYAWLRGCYSIHRESLYIVRLVDWALDCGPDRRSGPTRLFNAQPTRSDQIFGFKPWEFAPSAYLREDPAYLMYR